MSAKERWLGCVRRWRLQPDGPGADDCWAPELERAPRGRLEEIQSEKVAAAAAYLYEDSPFYRAKFDEVGLRPGDVQSVEDLWKVPITRKQEWADDILRHPPWGTFSPLRAALGAHADARALARRVVDAVRRELGLDAGCEVLATGTLRRVDGKARRVHDRRRVRASGADRA